MADAAEHEPQARSCCVCNLTSNTLQPGMVPLALAICVVVCSNACRRSQVPEKVEAALMARLAPETGGHSVFGLLAEAAHEKLPSLVHVRYKTCPAGEVLAQSLVLLSAWYCT